MPGTEKRLTKKPGLPIWKGHSIKQDPAGKNVAVSIISISNFPGPSRTLSH